MRAGFNLARAATGVLPGILQEKRSRVRIPRDGRSPRRDHIRRSARPTSAWAVSGRSDVHNTGSCEIPIVFRLIQELAGAPAHGDFAAAVCCDQIRSHEHCLEQIEEPIRIRLHQKDFGIGGHGMRPLDIQRRLQFPPAARIQSGLRSGSIDHLKNSRRQTELCGESRQIGRHVWSVKRVYDRDGASAAGGIVRRFVGIAAMLRMRYQTIDAGDGRRRLKEIAGERRQFVGLRRAREDAAFRHHDSKVSMGHDTVVAGAFHAGFRDNDVPFPGLILRRADLREAKQ